jgi:hypothetical protein
MASWKQTYRDYAPSERLEKKQTHEVLIFQTWLQGNPHPEERAMLGMARVSKDGRAAHGSRRR